MYGSTDHRQPTTDTVPQRATIPAHLQTYKTNSRYSNAHRESTAEPEIKVSSITNITTARQSGIEIRRVGVVFLCMLFFCRILLRVIVTYLSTVPLEKQCPFDCRGDYSLLILFCLVAASISTATARTTAKEAKRRNFKYKFEETVTVELQTPYVFGNSLHDTDHRWAIKWYFDTTLSFK